MNAWLAGRNLFLILAVIALALGLNWLVLQTGSDAQIVPPPENVAEEFVRSAVAFRWQGAREQLTENLGQKVSEEQLLRLVEQIEQARGAVEQVHAIGSQAGGQQASATIEMTFEDRGTARAVFPLERENFLWKVSAVEPLLSFAGE